MYRRNFLAGVAAASVALAGCSGSDSGPESVAKEYLRAFYEDDTERMLELAHDDGPEESRLQGNTGEALHDLESMDASVVRESEGNATVRIEFTDTTGEESRNAEFELRKQDGEWRVWDFF